MLLPSLRLSTKTIGHKVLKQCFPTISCLILSIFPPLSAGLLPCVDIVQTLRYIKVNASPLTSPLMLQRVGKRLSKEDSLFTSKWMEADGCCCWENLGSTVSPDATTLCMCVWRSWLYSVVEIWLWRNSRFSLKALICMAEVIWSALLPAPHH